MHNLVYVDAPHTLMAVDLPGTVLPHASAVTISGQPARAWWRFLYTMRDVSAVHESFRYIRTVLETQGPFDVSMNAWPRVNDAGANDLRREFWVSAKELPSPP